MRTIQWDETLCELRMIDQRLLPGEFKLVSYQNYHEVATQFEIWLCGVHPQSEYRLLMLWHLPSVIQRRHRLSQLLDELEEAGRVLVAARPTAVNLPWAVQRMLLAANNRSIR
jgi:methylthioribose-1-phosphate isomerase